MKILSGPLILVSAFLSFLLSPPACHAGDTVFGDLERGLVRPEEVADQACCDRGSYSKSFDNWIKAYVNGRDAEAEKEWAGVLRAAKGAVRLTRLLSSVSSRLQFLEEGESEKLEKRGGEIPAFKTLLAATEHILGANTIQVASVLDYLSDKYRNRSEFATSVPYARKALNIKERLWGAADPRIFGPLMNLSQKELLAKDYESARAHAKRGLSLAQKYHSGTALYQAKTILFKLDKVRTDK